MSVYLIKGKGWRYDFTLDKQRYTEACFKTKTAAIRAIKFRASRMERERFLGRHGLLLRATSFPTRGWH